jgi:hypothetical protein
MVVVAAYIISPSHILKGRSSSLLASSGDPGFKDPVLETRKTRTKFCLPVPRPAVDNGLNALVSVLIAPRLLTVGA